MKINESFMIHKKNPRSNDEDFNSSAENSRSNYNVSKVVKKARIQRRGRQFLK